MGTKVAQEPSAACSRIVGQPRTRVVGDKIALALIDRVAFVIEQPRTNHRDVRQPRRSSDAYKSIAIRLQDARSIAAATSSLKSAALCNAPLILTISISRAAICPAGSL
jgi:hypothetical protein